MKQVNYIFLTIEHFLGLIQKIVRTIGEKRERLYWLTKKIKLTNY